MKAKTQKKIAKVFAIFIAVLMIAQIFLPLLGSSAK